MNKMQFKGLIVEESLEDNRILNSLDIVEIKITSENNPSDRWHIYKVNISEKDIISLSRIIKSKWYMHFWKDKKVVAIFKNKTFSFDYDDKNSWKEAINYGISLGIPREQLDFPIS